MITGTEAAVREKIRNNRFEDPKEKERYVNYILDHDNAKKIMATDYRNLPKQTKKQKKYYNQAKKRERKKSTRRVLELFDKIEHEPYMCLV